MGLSLSPAISRSFWMRPAAECVVMAWRAMSSFAAAATLRITASAGNMAAGVQRMAAAAGSVSCRAWRHWLAHTGKIAWMLQSGH
jgi:hypothetical protein